MTSKEMLGLTCANQGNFSKPNSCSIKALRHKLKIPVKHYEMLLLWKILRAHHGLSKPTCWSPSVLNSYVVWMYSYIKFPFLYTFLSFLNF